ncbi:hypothetical protein [Kallotenue papyrolyticum]|uniref:hypothetical protein n=1 Tax=Kallotenue papyrolyticum TaxID=1325125 RepID=UPI0004786149|nr:hypothetical protein [Kallotenue papyrolyticum]
MERSLEHARAEQQRIPATLIGVLAGQLALSLALTWWCWLPRWLPRGRVTLGTLTGREAGPTLLILALGVGAYALYLLGALVLARQPASRRALPLIWLSAGAMTLILLAAFPVTSTDIFDYIFRGHMALRYGANPYVIVPNRFQSDPFYRYIGWPNAPSAYGPLWERLSMTLVELGGTALLRHVLLFKALAAASHLLIGLLIGQLAPPRWRSLSCYLWLCCPLALWELAGAGHNDGLLILALLLALLAVRRRGYALAVLALVAGALIKFLPALLLPLVVLAWLREPASWSRRLGRLACALLLALIPMVALYAPYWDLPADLASRPLAEQLAAIWAGRRTTLYNLSVRANFLHATPMAWLSYLAQRLIVAPTTRDAQIDDLRRIISLLSNLLLLLGLLWQSWWSWLRHRPLATAFFGLLVWYLLSGLWFQPWYLLWLLALLALRPPGWALIILYTWSITAQASYLLQFIVLPRLEIGGQTLAAQSLYLALIYPLPLLVWWLTRPSRLRRRLQHPPVPQAIDSAGRA